MRRVIAIHRNSGWPEAQAGGTVTLSYLDRHRRRLRLSADDGTPFLLDLPRATVLGEGDGLELEGGGFLRVRAAAEALAEITCRDGAELARIAWHLGNRHLPMQVFEGRLRIRWDHVIVGQSGASNSISLSGGAHLVSGSVTLGQSSAASNNVVTLAGAGTRCRARRGSSPRTANNRAAETRCERARKRWWERSSPGPG